VRTSTDLEEVVRDADFVIEAVSEDLPLKQRVFGELDRLCRHHTILASNSSTFMPSSLASATGRPDKVLVTHYFNPPYLVPAVEIVRHEGTSDETFDTAFALFQQIGKRPVRVQKEALGFIGNRLQAALVRECFSLVDKGIASAEDIDAVVRYGLGRRLSVAGPLEIADVAGLDIYSTLMSHILPDLDAATSPPQALAENVRDGNLGVKTGQGTYSWTPESSEETRQRIANALIEIQKWSA
ncbi:MAG: 3-hydroxyacyl-CoA dehydrogenase family protein, partial [Chloroflexi bacterium]|nr:3-hydroxyacyl-CoA dehydrogenase family protein [Chloroflexota bacterium]